MLGKEEIKAVAEVLKSGNLAQGRKVEEFERKFAEYIDVEHAIAVCNGTAALHLAWLALGIGSGDEIITTPFSFIASSNSILLAGAKPVFVDIELDTYNIDPEGIKEKINEKTKALLPVHLYGHPANMKAICEIAEDWDLYVIEDACQAHGASYNGKKVGSFGDLSAFSFYPTKNITTGEGGMITTSDGEIANKLRLLRNHGSNTRYLHEILGFNLRMTDISAAIGIEQLKKLDQFNERRRENAAFLSKKLRKINGIITPRVKRRYKHVFHQYTIRVTEEFKMNRDRVALELSKRGIGTGVYYPIPIHKQPFYRKLGYNCVLPNSELAAREVLSLPVHPGVDGKDINYIAISLREIGK